MRRRYTRNFARCQSCSARSCSISVYVHYIAVPHGCYGAIGRRFAQMEWFAVSVELLGDYSLELDIWDVGGIVATGALSSKEPRLVFEECEGWSSSKYSKGMSHRCILQFSDRHNTFKVAQSRQRTVPTWLQVSHMYRVVVVRWLKTVQPRLGACYGFHYPFLVTHRRYDYSRVSKRWRCRSLDSPKSNKRFCWLRRHEPFLAGQQAVVLERNDWATRPLTTMDSNLRVLSRGLES
jgi:hypothetical protein